MAAPFVRFQDLLSKVEPGSRLQRVLQFPLSRIVLAVLFLAPALIVRGMSHNLGRQYLSEGTFSWIADGWLIVSTLLLIGSYYLYTRIIERRPAREFSTFKAFPEFGVGLLAGASPIIIIVAILYLSGHYAAEGLGNAGSLLHLVRVFGWAALVEEMLFRLIVFRLVEEWLGSLWAIGISAMLFGLGHAFNPNVTVWSTICITLLSLPETAAFLATRRIWLAWGSHFGWNYFLTAVFGMTVSGVTGHQGFIVSQVSGPDWLTGGAFGIEASLPGVALSMVVAGLFFRIALRRGQFVRAGWVKKQRQVVTEL